MNYAIITPSFAPDFERCRLLSQSVDRYISGNWHHYILVDWRDHALFSELEGPRRSLIDVESVLPWWIRRAPFARRWWFSFKTPPIRNWVLQQIVKLSAAQYLTEDVFVFSDSDMAYIRPFSIDAFEREGNVRLYRVPDVANIPTHQPWHRTAGRLLGLPPSDYYGATYIGNPTTWRRDVLLKLYDRIEKVSGKPWIETICRQWHLSEYMLYGIFAEHVLGRDSGHYDDPVPLSHNSWDYKIETDEELKTYFSEVRPCHVAVMVSAKQYLPVARYQHHLTSGRLAENREQPVLVGSCSDGL